MCANCKSKQGPFYTSWGTWAIPICKNTKKDPLRVTNCVERRDKIDSDKFKELMHPYDA